METLATHTGRGAVLRRAGSDPDLLANWQADPGRVLGRAGYASATILIASADFAACPARGQAVTDKPPPSKPSPVTPPLARLSPRALPLSALDLPWPGGGFLMVVSAGVDEIFCRGLTKSGVRLLYLPVSKISELQDMVDANPATPLTIDFGQREMTAAGKFSAVFEIVSWRLVAASGPAGGC